MKPAPGITFWVLVVTALLTVAGGDAGAAPKDVNADALKDLERSLEEGERRADALSRALGQLSEEVVGLRRDLVAKANRIQHLEREQVRLEERLDDLLRTEGELDVRLERSREDYARVLFALQRLARHPPEALLAQPSAPRDTVRGAILLRSAVPEIEGRAAALRAELDALERARTEIAHRQTALVETTADLKAERRRMSDLLALKDQAQKETELREAAERRRIATLARKAESLKDLMDSLAAEEQRRAAERQLERQKAERKQIAPTRIRPPSKPVTEKAAESKEQQSEEPEDLAEVAAAPVELRPFAEQRGRLPWPVVGRVTGTFGESLETGMTRRGLTLATRPGAQVVAPHEARVAYAGPFRGYGLLLILEHGDGYHTLLAGMGRIDSETGQTVLAGEPVGIMADEQTLKAGQNSGSGAAPTLYVEFRKKGQPINPMPWLRASTAKVSG